MSSLPDPSVTYDTMIEVIEPRSRRVLAQTRLPQAIVVSSDGLLHATGIRVRQDGEVVIDVWRLSLHEPNTGRLQ